jgi:hypothetical protein
MKFNMKHISSEVFYNCSLTNKDRSVICQRKIEMTFNVTKYLNLSDLTEVQIRSTLSLRKKLFPLLYDSNSHE